MLPSLYNTEINERHAIGFCHKHKRYLSVTQLKRKECLKKQCNALERREHEFWRQRELMKQRKQEKRFSNKMLYNHKEV